MQSDSLFKRTLGVLAAALLIVAPNLAAQQAGSIGGLVLDPVSSVGIDAAQVFISDLGIGALTNQIGRYVLPNVAVGTHTLTVVRIGFRSSSQQAGSRLEKVVFYI